MKSIDWCLLPWNRAFPSLKHLEDCRIFFVTKVGIVQDITILAEIENVFYEPVLLAHPVSPHNFKGWCSLTEHDNSLYSQGPCKEKTKDVEGVSGTLKANCFKQIDFFIFVHQNCYLTIV